MNIKIQKYQKNAKMTGWLYLLGTVFGITAAITGGEVLASIVSVKPLLGSEVLGLVVADQGSLLMGSFFTLLMGVSLVGMTAFLYPVLKQESEELALGMLLFRGALEGVWYMMVVLNMLLLLTIGNEYVAMGSTSLELQSLGSIIYSFQDILAPVGTFMFLIGSTCLYILFYKTKLIPRWLVVWGFLGVIPYMIYALLHYFYLDNGIGFYLQMVLAPQEIVMALWLIIKGFDSEMLEKLMNK